MFRQAKNLEGRFNLDKALERKIKKLCREHPTEVAQILLESHFWLQGLESNTHYKRFDDETYQGFVSVMISEDGDGWVEVWSRVDEEDPFSHRFRMPLHGGGQSPRMRTAVTIMALAIKLDNEERPQNRPPRPRDPRSAV